MRHIYVSPHADDVALSCGGQIIAAASMQDILILNVFSSDRHDSNGPVAPGAGKFDRAINDSRTEEDRLAWQTLGVATCYCSLPEAMLRGDFPVAIVNGTSRPDVVDQVYEALKITLSEYPTATFHFPAGIGNHVDHLACRDAGLRLLDQGLAEKVIFYEDIPYSWLKFIRKRHYKRLLSHVKVDSQSVAGIFRADGLSLTQYLSGKTVPFPRGKKLFALVYLGLLARNRPRPGQGAPKRYIGQLCVTTLDPNVISRKIALIQQYQSQLAMLFGTSHAQTLFAFQETFLSKEVALEVSRAP